MSQSLDWRELQVRMSTSTTAFDRPGDIGTGPLVRRRERDHTETEAALVRRDAVCRRLARERALAVLQVAVVRPARDIVLTLKGDRSGYRHLPACGRDSRRSGWRRGCRSGGGRTLLSSRIRAVGRGGSGRRLLGVRGLRLRIRLRRAVPLGRVWLRRIGGRCRRRCGVVLLFCAAAENSEKRRHGSAE